VCSVAIVTSTRATGVGVEIGGALAVAVAVGAVVGVAVVVGVAGAVGVAVGVAVALGAGVVLANGVGAVAVGRACVAVAGRGVCSETTVGRSGLHPCRPIKVRHVHNASRSLSSFTGITRSVAISTQR